MKKELSKYKILIDSISKTSYFKIVVCLSILLVLYGFSLGKLPYNDFMYSLFFPYSIDFFNMIFFLLLLLNSINIYLVVKKNYNYLIRLENRKNYIISLVNINLIFNAVWCLIIFLLLLSCNIIFRIQFFNINTVIEGYNIGSFIYGCFYMIRYYFMALLFSTIFILLLSKFGKKYIFIVMLIFSFGFLFINDTMDVISSFQILPWKYFMYINYSSFMMEVCYSLLYCIILEVIIIILYRINISQKKFKIKEIYFLLNNLEYFVKKNKIILLICCLIPLLSCFSSDFDLADGNYVFQTSLGLNIEDENRYMLSVLWYCINIFSCIYIFINSFVKDYSNLANIYLRYNYKVYYFIKSIINIILMFILKLIQYGLVTGVLRFTIRKNFGGLVNLFINDLSLTLFLGFLVLLLYVLYKIFKKCRIVIGIIMIICFYMFIINPLDISKINCIFYGIGIIFIILISNYIIIKNNKKVIQEIGGV